ncbi:polysaccharide deacetylase family protein [Calothrix sp. UHCC 0171]|uniref:polysaccharide deacetylase family protein n=1 Tax=Calothrix sp. UHCC 0171 TaxID=3110245 RepID=UPI002B20B459|nr:polysaccharide deacetylase family protein [Calothrix sp. UHCC 0171]MEA5572224.1 polysaccharide deacetylase family protein [Calothrix sp. UHCC 0171]
MENKNHLGWSQNAFIALLGIGGCLGLGLILSVIPDSSEIQSTQKINIKNLSLPAITEERIEGIKSSMLTSWQKEASTKGVSDIPQRFQGATFVEAKLPAHEKVIALTFDDGPWSHSTSQILDILKKNKIKGTFFVVGQMLQEHPNMGKRVVAEGHTIANHTWHHWYHYMNPQASAFEVDNTSNLIYKVTGVKTSLFRPPGGIKTNGPYAYAKNRKYASIMWSSDSVDYSRPSVPKLINNVMREARPGGIVLMHDGGGNRSNTVQALPQIINNFRKQGYRFVTIPELLELQDKQLQMLAAKKK